MTLNDTLYQSVVHQAQQVDIEILSLGLGYTAVTTSAGGIGLSYTYFQEKKTCMMLNRLMDFEGRPAAELLPKIHSGDSIERSMALALINALNHEQARELPTDPENTVLFDTFGICRGTRVAMVGFFGPLIKIFKQRRAELEIIDEARGLDGKQRFYDKLNNWAQVLFLTSTSILNNSTEEILARVHSKTKTVMLGPSTPMIAEAFRHLPVDMLAGTVPIEKEPILRSVRHGMGTPVLQKFSRKAYLLL